MGIPTCRTAFLLVVGHDVPQTPPSFIIAPRLHYRHEFEVSASTTIRLLSHQRHNR